jgi:hypothetical protein
MKLKLFQKQLENVNLCHFSSCNLLQNDGSVSVPFARVHAVEMIHSLADNFKMRSNDFRSHATNKCIFEDPFSVMLPEKLQLELSELQYDSILRSSFNQEALITLYAFLPVYRSSVRNLAAHTHVNRLFHV